MSEIPPFGWEENGPPDITSANLEKDRNEIGKYAKEQAVAAEGASIPISQKGAHSGVAELDSSGKLPIGEIPAPNVGGHYEQSFGDGVHSSFTIVHKLNTLTPAVTVVNQATGQEEGCNIRIVDENTVELAATAWIATPPGVAAYRVSADASSGLVATNGSVLTGYALKSEVGANNGIAPLDGSGKLPLERLQSSVATDSAPPPSGGDDTAALIAAMPTTGVLKLRRGTYKISGRVTLAAGQDFVGAGGSGSGAFATEILCTSESAGITAEGAGGVTGLFTINANNVATEPFVRKNPGSERNFVGLCVEKSAQDNWTILGAQNDCYTGCNSTKAARDNLYLDKGCGGLLFLRFEGNEPGRYNLRSDNAVGGGPYTLPTHITFEHCIFERGACTSHLYLNAYSLFAFRNCDISGAEATGPIVNMVGSAGRVLFDGGVIFGSTSTTTALSIVAGPTLVIQGDFKLENHLNGISLGTGSPNIQVIGRIFFTSVTNEYTGEGTQNSVLSRFVKVRAPAIGASGLTGATAASRYVGATTLGAPVSGTFEKGDLVIDQTGTIWTCTASGTPGTWKEPAPVLNFERVFGGKGDGKYLEVGTTNESTTVTLAGGETGLIGKVICGENIPVGTTITASNEAGTSFTISHAATGTKAASKVLVGTDNSSAWKAYWAAVNPIGARPKSAASPGNALQPSAGIEVNPVFQHELYQPAGIYITTEPEAMMKATTPSRSGLHWTGAGMNATYNVYAPSEANSFMMRNTEAILNITFEHMTFACLDSTASFMASVGPTAQNYVHNRVNWTGNWKYGYKLTGSNNNSEHLYEHCGIHGYWTAFLFSPSPEAEGSDQFLNYRFVSCQVEYRAGNFVDMASGGSIDMTGGSLIHSGTGEEKQIFFALRGKSHASGGCRLNIDGVRIEHRHILSKLMLCEWEQGIISIRSYDGSAIISETLPLTSEVSTELESEATIGATILNVKNSGGAHPITVGMPLAIEGSGANPEIRICTEVINEHEIKINEALTYAHVTNTKVERAVRKHLLAVEILYPLTLLVKFDNCNMPGRHLYGYSNSPSAYLFKRKVLYDTCRILDWEYAGPVTGFVCTHSTDGTNNEGNKTPIKFRDCTSSVGSGGRTRYINGTIYGSVATATEAELHTIRFKTSIGSLPYPGETSLEALIQPEAVIVAVRAKKNAGGTSTVKNWKYKLLDESNSGAVIAEVKGNEVTEWKSAWAYEEKFNLHITGSALGTNQWKLKLVEENAPEGIQASWFEVDYIA